MMMMISNFENLKDVMVVPGPAERAGGHGNSDRTGSAEMMTYLSK